MQARCKVRHSHNRVKWMVRVSHNLSRVGVRQRVGVRHSNSHIRVRVRVRHRCTATTGSRELGTKEGKAQPQQQQGQAHKTTTR